MIRNVDAKNMAHNRIQNMHPNLNDCGNLFKLINTLHGREIYVKEKKFKVLRIKLSKVVIDLSF